MNWLMKLYCGFTKRGHRYSIYTHRCSRCNTLNPTYAHWYDEHEQEGDHETQRLH